MMLALALTACASKPAAPTAADFEVQPGEYRYQDVDIFFVETEKGNYYMNPSGGGLIHFAEPGSHEFHVLCNKPNCGHASADCNAFLEVAFGYYNGHLYGVTLQDHFELIQMDMDGTNHRVITQLPEQKDLSGNFNGGGSYFFDNGYRIMRCRSTRSSWRPGRPHSCFRKISRFSRTGQQTVCPSAMGTSTFPCPRHPRASARMRKETWRPGVSSGYLRTGSGKTVLS